MLPNYRCVLARSLIYEPDQIERNFILVIDGYHVIYDKKMFDPEYMSKLYELEYWPAKSDYPWLKGPPGFETE